VELLGEVDYFKEKINLDNEGRQRIASCLLYERHRRASVVFDKGK